MNQEVRLEKDFGMQVVTFCDAINCEGGVAKWACSGGDVDDAASSGDGGVEQ
jgi:hypothetical protein